MVAVLILTSLVNVVTMTWFLYRYGAVLNEFNTLKISCLLLENIFLMYMIAVFFRIDEPEDLLDWIERLCLISFAGFLIEGLICYIVTGKTGVTFIKDSSSMVDPALRIYLRTWERIYIESVLLSTFGSAIILGYVLYKWIAEYYDERKKAAYLERYFKKIRYDGSMEQRCCAICLSDYEVEEEIVECPCRHVFHNECITSWLKDKENCPVCRQDFFTEPEQAA